MSLLKLSLRNIRASVGRLMLTALAITAGVGFVAGSFILADSLSDTFSSIFESAGSRTDATVQLAELAFGEDDRTLSDSIIAELEALDETAEVRPTVTIDTNSSFRPFVVLDAEGEEVIPQGPPIITFSWDGTEIEDQISLVAGTPPNGIDEVVLDSTYAEAAGVEVGQTVNFVGPDGPASFTLVGLVEFPVTGGAFFVIFDFDSAQVLYDKVGQVDTVELVAASGTTPTELIAAAQSILPPEAEVIDSEQAIEEAQSGFNDFIAIFRNVLLGFAGIALFVSLFIIYNTFAILVSQRIQQIGMLRALGATAGQIRLSIVIEAVVIGLISSLVGIFAGVGVATLIKAGFQAAGGFPETGTVVTTNTIIISFAVGTIATLFSALGPAFSASRVSPIAAMRNEKAGGSSQRRRVLIGSVVLALGLLLLGLGLFGSGLATATLLFYLAVGAILTFVGVALLSVLFAGPIVNFLGRPEVLGSSLLVLGLGLIALVAAGSGLPDGIVSTVSFVIKMFVSGVAIITGLSILLSKSTGRSLGLGGSAGGLEGQLAKQNAARNPQRTAATATALTIGIALVATVGTVGESLKASFSESLERGVQAELFIFDEETNSAFPGELADQIAEIEGIENLSRFRFNEVRLGVDANGDDDIVDIAAFETSTGESLINFSVVEGSITDAGDSGVLVFTETADERGLSVGDTLAVDFPDGESEELTVSAIFEDNSVLNSPIVFDLAIYERHVTNGDDFFVGATVADSADFESVKAQAQAVAADFSGVSALDNDEFRDGQTGQIDGLITLINFMLSFALFVAFLGVINTIVLSVIERTREIGLLRAVGTTRQQMKSMIRWEAVIVCLFGALLGIILGVLFAWAAVTAIPDDIISTLALPYETVAFAILVAALAGVVAASLPARRAARMNVLEAIATNS